MPLPLKTTSDDVRAIVKYLRTKPTGATIDEAKAVSRRLVDGRKVAAYISWGVAAREDARLKLTNRGDRLAQNPDRESDVFREIVGSKTPYRSILERAFHQEMSSIDANAAAAHWHEHHSDVVGDANDTTLRENAVCFFNVAEAAGLGKMVRGRNGSATRLELDPQATRNFVEAGPVAPPWDETADVEEVEPAAERQAPPAAEEEKVEPAAAEETLRVFISHGSNHAIVEQIETMLEISGIDAEIAITEETTAIPVPEKVLAAMRRCGAGVIAVTVDEGRRDEAGNYTLNENVLIEIGAAFVLYDRRVILVWDKRLEVPSNLQGLYRCEFEGDELAWASGMKLLKAINDFKSSDE